MSGEKRNAWRHRLSELEYVDGVRSGDRAILARAITLVESRRPSDQELAQRVLQRLLPDTGAAHRIGVTGVPGVGKSTFLDAFGMHLLEQGKRVAVLAIDPSSALSGGSILGDKTRMPRLSVAPGAFIRPSPSDSSLGGIARRTRESLLLCEAAGYDVVLIETVGVGQSETMVSELVDCFLVLMLPGAGDELQGIKKGLLELADIVAVNKADGDNLARAREAVREYAAALRYLQPRLERWKPRVTQVSGLTGEGLVELWQTLLEHRVVLQASGEQEALRRRQARIWMWRQVEEQLLARFHADPAVRRQVDPLLLAVDTGRLTPTQAALELLRVYDGSRERPDR